MNTPKRGNEQTPVAGRPSDDAESLLHRAMEVCLEIVRRGDHAAHNAANLRNRIDIYLQHGSARELDAANPAQGAELDVPVAWILRTGHGSKVVIGPLPPKCEINLWKPLYAAAQPQASSGDASMVEVQQATQELGWRREDVRDAARYRWLRRHFKFGNDSLREGWFDACVDSDGNEFDRAIDAAMHPVRGSGGGE